MGANCCGQDREIPHMNILQKAINQSLNKESYSSLLASDHKQSIKKLFYGNNPSQTHQRYQQTMVKVLPLIEKTHSNIELVTDQYKKKLVITINQQSSLRSQTNIENKSSIIIQAGFIIYQNGYYEGDIVNNKQNGLGVFYLLSDDVIIIKGQWQSGKFIKGNLFKRQLNKEIGTQQKLISLELKDGVKKAVVETDNFYYQGSIKLDIKNLDQMMTGEGTIYFKNTKAIYTGKIKNGLFQTEEGEKSKFSINQETLKQMKFQGSYQNGLRQNKGIVSFNYWDINYKLILQYLDGKPKDQEEIKKYENWTIAKYSEIISRPVEEKKAIN